MKKKILICGNFNIVHSGHIRIFEFAKKMNTKLIVGVFCDKKAGKKVFIKEKQRLECVKSNTFVDEVHLINSSLKNFILKIKPDILLKGQEFEKNNNPELKYLDKIGAKLIFGSGSTNYSSLEMISNEFIDNNYSQLVHEKDYLDRHQINSKKLINITKKFNKLKVAVIGDSIIDEYILTNPIGMSREDTTIVVAPISSNLFVGGAAIVAAHAASLGAESSLFTINGKDKYNKFLEKKLKNYNVKSNIFIDDSRNTNLKKRYRVPEKTLLRVNLYDQREISKKIQDKIFNKIKKISSKLDLLVFSDFNFGCLPAELVKNILSYLKKKNIFIVADSQTSSQIGNIGKFKNVNLITPTEHEARVELKDFTSGIVKISLDLIKETQTKDLMLTLNKEGVLIQGGSKYQSQTEKLPSLCKLAKDPAGCGDALLITSSMAMSCGANLWEAAYLGSIAAGLQAQSLGNIPLTLNKIKKEINNI